MGGSVSAFVVEILAVHGLFFNLSDRANGRLDLFPIYRMDVNRFSLSCGFLRLLLLWKHIARSVEGRIQSPASFVVEILIKSCVVTGRLDLFPISHRR